VSARVTVLADRVVVEHLELVDADLARLVEERPEAERPELVQRALKIGLLALRDAGVTVNIDFVQKEIERLLVQVDERNRQASQALDSVLRQEFAEDGGRLPRTLERFLGDQGAFRKLVAELFDPRSRESAIGKFETVLGTYFDGDSSRLAQLLDPTREGSPLYRFHSEITRRLDTLAAEIKAQAEADRARREERAKGTAKGADFEDVLEGMLGPIAQGLGDVLERTGTVAGDEIKGKKGDFVLTVDPGRTGGHQLRVVIESKDRAMSVRAITEELAEARHRGVHPATCAGERPSAGHRGSRRLVCGRSGGARPPAAGVRGAPGPHFRPRFAARGASADPAGRGPPRVGGDPHPARRHPGHEEPADLNCERLQYGRRRARWDAGRRPEGVG
jgi:hypothetical protein